MSTNKKLIAHIVHKGELRTKIIKDAFLDVDRKDFIPKKFLDEAYLDIPISIGHSVTTSQPSTIAFMLEKIRPDKGDKILEIGTGSGYLTALLSKIVGDKGKVFSIEYIPEIKKLAQKNLKKYKFKNVKLIVGDGKKGIPDEAPFDKIIASASASEIPKAWKKQLVVGGKIVTPFDTSLILIKKISKNKFKIDKFHYFLFVELK